MKTLLTRQNLSKMPVSLFTLVKFLGSSVTSYCTGNGYCNTRCMVLAFLSFFFFFCSAQLDENEEIRVRGGERVAIYDMPIDTYSSSQSFDFELSPRRTKPAYDVTLRVHNLEEDHYSRRQRILNSSSRLGSLERKLLSVSSLKDWKVRLLAREVC